MSRQHLKFYSVFAGAALLLQIGFAAFLAVYLVLADSGQTDGQWSALLRVLLVVDTGMLSVLITSLTLELRRLATRLDRLEEPKS